MKDDNKDNDCESVMKKIQLIATVVGLLIIIGGVNSSFAASVQVQTNITFSCSSNEDCKKKCEALKPPGTWKSNPGGSTFGTCTQKSQSLPGDKIITDFLPTKAEFDSLTRVTKKDQEILKELNLLFSKSYLAKELELENGQIISLSIVLNRKKGAIYDGPPCATCLGDGGVTATLCCSPAVPNCNDPCRDGDYNPDVLFAE